MPEPETARARARATIALNFFGKSSIPKPLGLGTATDRVSDRARHRLSQFQCRTMEIDTDLLHGDGFLQYRSQQTREREENLRDIGKRQTFASKFGDRPHRLSARASVSSDSLLPRSTPSPSDSSSTPLPTFAPPSILWDLRGTVVLSSFAYSKSSGPAKMFRSRASRGSPRRSPSARSRTNTPLMF